MINAALEREAIAIAVSAESLRARGHDRAPERDHGRGSAVLFVKQGIDRTGWHETLANREVLHRDFHPWENDLNLVAWHEQKAREGLRDMSRQAVIDHVRDRFWRQDRSPAREQERTESLLRAIDREYDRSGRERAHTSPVEPVRERQRGRSLPGGLGLDDTAQGGAHMREHTPETALEVSR